MIAFIGTETHERYSIIDYKSNFLNCDENSIENKNLSEEELDRLEFERIHANRMAAIFASIVNSFVYDLKKNKKYYNKIQLRLQSLKLEGQAIYSYLFDLQTRIEGKRNFRKTLKRH